MSRRMRRLRVSGDIRRLVRETKLDIHDYIYPLFIIDGNAIKSPVSSMPGIYQYSLDRIGEELDRVQAAGIKTIMLFGIPDQKDAKGSQAYAEDGITQKALRQIKQSHPDLVLSTDVCLCEYTDHGHCGLIDKGHIQNDPTLDLLCQVAVSHARAGAQILAPSDMMDFRVAAIRKALDAEGFTDVLIMSHAAKYASAFYGPFRDAAGSAPQFGDRKTYQMDPASGARQAMAELALDVEEGADILIIKPGLAYLDLVAKARARFDQPICAYNVSGEYSMVKAAAQAGCIDEKAVVLEMMQAFKRAGCDMVITYHALDLARWIEEELL